MQTFDVVTLRLISAIAREGSLSKAAAQEHIAPSAVSRRIAELEHGLGAQLLRRHSSGVSLTPAGQAFAGHCERILEYFAEVKGDLGAFVSGVKGELRVVAATSALMHGVPALVAAFQKECPEVEVTLQELYSKDAVHALRDDRADIAVVSDNIDIRGIETELFTRDPIWVIGPVGHPVFSAIDASGRIAFAEVIRYPTLGFRQGGVLDDLIAQAAAAAKAPAPRHIHVNRFDTLRRCVEAGLGLACLPQGSTMLHTYGGTIQGAPLSDDWADRSLLFGYLKSAAKSPQIQSFLAVWRASKNASVAMALTPSLRA